MSFLSAFSLITFLSDSNLTEIAVSQWLSFIADLKAHAQIIQSHLLDLTSQRKEVAEFNEKKKTKMTDRYNWEVIHRELSVRELVFLHQKKSVKLKAHWRGSFIVTESDKHTNFHIQQINSCQIKWTFYENDL